MSTSVTKNVYNNKPISIKVQAKGYWDKSAMFVPTRENNSIFVEQDKYDNAKISFIEPNKSAGIVSATGDALPNYWEFKDKKVCLMPIRERNYKEILENKKALNSEIENIGISITEEGISSGYSSSNYLVLPTSFPTSIESYSLTFRAMISTLDRHCTLLAKASSGESQFSIRNNSGGYMSVYTNSSWTTGKTPIQTGVYYWYKFNFDGTNLTAYLLEDNGYTIDTLPDLGSWSLEFSSNVNPLSNNIYRIGQNYNATSEYFNGEIDLLNSRIIVNGEDFIQLFKFNKKDLPGCLFNYSDNGSATTLDAWYIVNNSDFSTKLVLTKDDNVSIDGCLSQWVGSINLPQHDVFNYTGTVKELYSNFTNVGADVNLETGVSSGFTQSKYISMPKAFPSNISALKIIFNAKISKGGNAGALLAKHSDGEAYIGYSESNKFGSYYSGWSTGNTTLVIGQNYWFGVGLSSNGELVGYLLLDDGTYSLDTLPEFESVDETGNRYWSREFTKTNFLNENSFDIGSNIQYAHGFFEGEIYLSKSKIYVNNSEFWNPLIEDEVNVSWNKI